LAQEAAGGNAAAAALPTAAVSCPRDSGAGGEGDGEEARGCGLGGWGELAIRTWGFPGVESFTGWYAYISGLTGVSRLLAKTRENNQAKK